MMADRKLEVRALVDGRSIPGFFLKTFEIDSSRYESCDVASASFVVDRSVVGTDDVWFEKDATANIAFMLQMRDLAAVGDWKVIFEGQVDHVQYFPDLDIVEVECRDFLARLLDTRIQQEWLNNTGEELLESVARSAGLAAQVRFPAAYASVMNGQFWQVEHKRLALMSHHRFQTAADIAFAVARDSGCDLYVEGQTLVCTPVLSADDDDAVVHDVRGGVLARSFGRDIQGGRGFGVCVASWDSRQRSATSVYFDGKSFSAVPVSRDVPIYSFRLPGRRLEDLKRLAVGKYARIAAHGRSAHVSLPGRMEVRPRHFLYAGDGIWGKALAVDRVISRFSVESGFVQDIVLRDRGGLR